MELFEVGPRFEDVMTVSRRMMSLKMSQSQNQGRDLHHAE